MSRANAYAAGHLLGKQVVSHHPLYMRTNSNTTERDNNMKAMQQSQKLVELADMTDRH